MLYACECVCVCGVGVDDDDDDGAGCSGMDGCCSMHCCNATQSRLASIDVSFK